MSRFRSRYGPWALVAGASEGLGANYAATKAYARVLAEGLWEELREHGVDVLACSAGATATPGYLGSLPERPGFHPPVLDPATVAASFP